MAVYGWNRVTTGARVSVLSALLVVLLGFSCRLVHSEESESHPTIVVFGDSQAAGLARGLQRLQVEDSGFRVLNRTHAGAALVHDEAEWLRPIRRFTAREKADIAVVMFGANDRLDMREGRTTLRFRSEEWRAAYAARITKILDLLRAANLRVLWLGNPIARSARYSEDMSYINQLYADTMAPYKFEFMPLWAVVADEEGGYTAYGKDRSGVTQRLRGDDGIHFTAAGYELIAEQVIDMLSQAPPAEDPPGAPAPAPGAAP